METGQKETWNTLWELQQFAEGKKKKDYLEKKKGNKMEIIKKEIASFSLITLKISVGRQQFLCNL